MKKYLFIAVAFFGMLFVTSCESDESFTSYSDAQFDRAYRIYKDTIKALGWEEREKFFYEHRFMSIDQRLEEGLPPAITRSGGQIEPVNPGEPLLPELRIKFSFEWGINILSLCVGYGTPCKISFELDTNQLGNTVQPCADEGYVETDRFGRKYIDLLFSEDPGTGSETPAMIVSDDISGDVFIPSDLEEYVTHDIPERMILPQGNYQYNSALGLHGGYRIYLTVPNN